MMKYHSTDCQWQWEVYLYDREIYKSPCKHITNNGKICPDVMQHEVGNIYEASLLAMFDIIITKSSM